VETVVTPALLYPYINIYFLPRPVSSIMTSLQCAALGINRHFPRAILYGPTCLGGCGLPSPTQKITRERINYFLYNIRSLSSNFHQLEISIIYTQLEVRTVQQLFSIPFSVFGHLTFPTFCVQLWKEIEPYGLLLRPAQMTTWTPQPYISEDQAPMEVATYSYNRKGSAMINWC
jgi:hypothetical protein